MMVAAFVGTTMAAATFLSRPLFIQGKGWTMDNQDQQKHDAIVAAVLVFIVSGAAMWAFGGVLLAWFVHVGAFLAAVLLLLGHLYIALEFETRRSGVTAVLRRPVELALLSDIAKNAA